MRKLKINRKGQFSIIAALLVAVVLIAAVMTTYSAIRYSTVGDNPQVLNAVDEINLALRQVVGFTVGYYGSVLQVTGNTSYARVLASNYLQSGLENMGDIRPEWGASFNVTTLDLRTDWFSNASFSSGNLSVTYNLGGIGLYNVTYFASSRLDVEILESSPSQAFVSITKDESEPIVNLAKQNLRFYHYLDDTSTWDLVAPTVDPIVYANGTYVIDFPDGVDPDSYVMKIEDQRGITVVASSFSSYSATLNRNSTYTDADYVDNNDSDVDSSADVGTQSNFATQQSAPDSIYDTLTEVDVGSGMTTSTLLDESFDSAWYPTDWSVWGYYWSRSGSIKKDGAYSAHWDGGSHRSGSMTTFNLNCAGADAIIVDFWYYDAGCEENDFWLDFYDGMGYPWTKVYDLGGTGTEGEWLHFYHSFTESQYLRSDFKIRFSASTSNNDDDMYVDCLTVQKVVDGTVYQLDLEEQFTNVNYTDPDQDLCIKAGSLGSEDLMVDVWTGSGWDNVAALTGLVNGWKNVSVSSYLTSSTLTIRFRGSSETSDSVQDSWEIDAVLLAPQPDVSFLLSQEESTIVVEWLQNGTMRFLGQNLEMTTAAKAIPPISVKALHLNQTINGVNQEVPFQVEDWASGYKIPLGLTSNATVFGSSQMIVFLLDNTVSAFTLWWDGSDEAIQTPLAYTPIYFSGDNPGSNTLTNGIIRLNIGSFSVTSTVVGTSTSSTAYFMRINGENSVYGAGAAYVIHHGVVRDVVQQEAEWSDGANNCPNLYANIVITLPANVTYYTYQLRLMFIDSTRTRTITDLCPIRLSSTLTSPQVQTEDGTAGGYPVVADGTGLFSNYTSGGWTAHHWSQLISGTGTSGTGIMFTDNANQKLYAFDPIAGNPTGALSATSTSLIELLPVKLQQVSPFMDAMDITWKGAVVTFDDTAPIYQDSDQSGLWILVEYPPTITVTAET